MITFFHMSFLICKMLCWVFSEINLAKHLVHTKVAVTWVPSWTSLFKHPSLTHYLASCPWKPVLGVCPPALTSWPKAPVGRAWMWLPITTWLGHSGQEAPRCCEINHDNSGRTSWWISGTRGGMVQMEVGVKQSFAGWSCFCTTYWSPSGGRKMK